MVGRYVFGDFVRGRIWSIALTRDPATGEATASDMRDHTAEINAGAAVRMISSFGVDAAGELYVVNYGDGTIVSLRAAQAAGAGAPDRHARRRRAAYASPSRCRAGRSTRPPRTPGIGTLHVWAFSVSGAAPQFLGVANYGISRPDVAAILRPAVRPDGVQPRGQGARARATG